MSHTYTHLIQAFIEICADKHGATFNDENIETLQVDGQPADSALIAQIKARADEFATSIIGGV